jgi:Cysteine-rich secretory protein family
MANITDNFDQQMLDLVNQERAKSGANPLKLNEKLDKAANEHTLDQANSNKMSHDGSNGSKFGDRLKNDGYLFSFAAENVAAGQTDPIQVMKSWMNSPGHRENILNPKLEEIGVGSATSKDGKLFWTQDFGTPMGGSTVANKPMNTPISSKPNGMKMATDPLESTTVGNPKNLQPSKDPLIRSAVANKPMSTLISSKPNGMKMAADPLGSTTVGNPKDLQPSKAPVSSPANKNPMGMKMSFAPTDMKTFEDMKNTPMFSGDVKNSQASTDPMGSLFNPMATPASNLPIGTPTNPLGMNSSSCMG